MLSTIPYRLMSGIVYNNLLTLHISPEESPIEHREAEKKIWYGRSEHLFILSTFDFPSRAGSGSVEFGVVNDDSRCEHVAYE